MNVSVFAESSSLLGIPGKLLFTTVKNPTISISSIALHHHSEIVVLETRENTLLVIKDRHGPSDWLVNSSTLYSFKDPEVEAFLSERLKFLAVKEVIE